MKSLRGWEFDELEGKSTATKKPNSYRESAFFGRVDLGNIIRVNHSIRWKKFFKSLLFLMGFLTICLPQNLQLQEGSCSEPKVAVYLKEIYDEVFDHLYRQHPFQPKEEWLRQIQDKVMQELRKNSPKTQFISTSGKSPEGCEYYFHYSLVLTGAGETKEIEGLKTSEYTAYLMTSNLATNNRCGVQNRLLGTEITQDNRDIFRTIELNIAAHGNIGNRIREYEQSDPIPPRGPVMSADQEPDKVSPLEEERELDIRIRVKNCKGEDVYDKYHGQLVILPRKTERGEIRPTEGFPQDFTITEKIVTLILTTPEGGSAIYTLKKGIEPGLERINMVTCGREKTVTQESEIRISGLEIDVKPGRRSLGPGEETQIQGEFSKVDKERNKEPVAGRQLQIEVKGLVDGDVSPEGDIKTDENGKATLTFCAGDKDKRVTFQAKYQPKGFDESVKGEATVKVIHKEVDALASIKFNYIETMYSDTSNPGEGKKEYSEYKKEVEVEVNAAFEFQKETSRSSDRVVEKYELIAWDIRSSLATYNVKSYFEKRDVERIEHHQGLAEQITRTIKGEGDVMKSERERKRFLTIELDAKSGIAKTVDLPSFDIDIKWKNKLEENWKYGDVDWDPYDGKFHSSRSGSFKMDQEEHGSVSVRNNFGPRDDLLKAVEGEKVKSGDGVQKLAGGASEEVELGDGLIKKKWTCTWEIERNLKKSK